jgi:hypothetical protein
MGAMGTPTGLTKMVAPISQPFTTGPNGKRLSLYDIMTAPKSAKRLKLGEIAPESQSRMTISQKRLFKNADRTLQNRMMKTNQLVVQGSQGLGKG